MARRGKRLCACGCGQEIDGRRNKLFVNDTHSKRCRRNGDLNAPENAHKAPEGGSGAGLVTDCGPDDDVRDYIEVCCSSCHRVRPGWEGPLQVKYFCRECVEAGLCPCENRPPWHSWVYGGGDRPW